MIVAISLFESTSFKAQCDLSADELEKISLMDTSQFRNYALQHGMEFYQKTKDNIMYVCSKRMEISCEISFKKDKVFHYEFPDMKWADTIESQLKAKGYKMMKKGYEMSRGVGNYNTIYESKTLEFTITANDGATYDIYIKKK